MNKEIIEKVEKLEKLIPLMKQSQEEASLQMHRSTKFIEYVKKWHPSVFDSAVRHIEMET